MIGPLSVLPLAGSLVFSSPRSLKILSACLAGLCVLVAFFKAWLHEREEAARLREEASGVRIELERLRDPDLFGEILLIASYSRRGSRYIVCGLELSNRGADSFADRFDVKLTRPDGLVFLGMCIPVREEVCIGGLSLPPHRFVLNGNNSIDPRAGLSVIGRGSKAAGFLVAQFDETKELALTLTNGARIEVGFHDVRGRKRILTYDFTGSGGEKPMSFGSVQN